MSIVATFMFVVSRRLCWFVVLIKKSRLVLVKKSRCEKYYFLFSKVDIQRIFSDFPFTKVDTDRQCAFSRRF